jgi:hypothetical protein
MMYIRVNVSENKNIGKKQANQIGINHMINLSYGLLVHPPMLGMMKPSHE